MSIRTRLQEKRDRIRATVSVFILKQIQRRAVKKSLAISKYTDRRATSAINSRSVRSIALVSAVALSALLLLMPFCVEAASAPNSSVSFRINTGSTISVTQSFNSVVQQVTGLRSYEPYAYVLPVNTSNFPSLQAGTTYNAQLNTTSTLGIVNLDPNSNKLAFSVGAYYIPNFQDSQSLQHNSYSLTLGEFVPRLVVDGTWRSFTSSLQIMSGYAVQGKLRGISSEDVPITYVAYQMVLTLPDSLINQGSSTVPVSIRLSFSFNFTSWITESLPGSLVFCFSEFYDYYDPSSENLGYFEQQFSQFIDEQKLQDNAEAAATAGQLVSDMATASVMSQQELAAFNSIATPLFTFAPLVTMLGLAVPVVLLLWALRKGTS